MMSLDFIILFSFYLGSTSASDITAPVNCKGFCALECVRQNRVYVNVEDTSVRETVKSTDPTVLVTTKKGAASQNSVCFVRSRQFTLIRRDIPGNNTHSEYRCSKNTNCDASGDVLIVYQSPWKVLLNNPHFCDVCNGVDLSSRLVMLDVKVREYSFLLILSDYFTSEVKHKNIWAKLDN
ncbi:uncharacterized protein [Mytilus edulis]|uniref:uncharacterized protein n=1 Tax=Mytilus edulis TaxID=6550 RepID=UPI0039F0D33F